MISPLLDTDRSDCRMVYLTEKPPSAAPAMLAGYPDLLTVQHMHEITGISKQVIRKEISEGKLPACRIGRRLFCPKSSFVDYAQNGGGLHG